MECIICSNMVGQLEIVCSFVLDLDNVVSDISFCD